MKDIDLSKYNISTDLACEAHDIAMKGKKKGSSISGVSTSESTKDGVTARWIRIKNEAGAKAIGKKPGTYLTLEIPKLRTKDSVVGQHAAEHLTRHFSCFLKEVGIGPDDSVLLVGLGNPNVTPDALGPLVVKQSIITRHLFTLAPDRVSKGYRSVAALQPGVLGTTGIETSETVHGVINRLKPDFVIAFDSLASRALSRVNTTIQICDAGIHPGSGVGNKRKALDKKTLGIPIIAIGVPTVVDAVTITHDTIDFILAHLSREIEGVSSNPLDPERRPNVRDLQSHSVSKQMKSHMMGTFGSLSQDEKRQLIHEVLSPLGQNLVVTPKEVDTFITHIAKIVATGVNCALHEAVNMDNVASHLH